MAQELPEVPKVCLIATLVVLLAVAVLHRLQVQRHALLLCDRAAPAELQIGAVGSHAERERESENVEHWPQLGGWQVE